MLFFGWVGLSVQAIAAAKAMAMAATASAASMILKEAASLSSWKRGGGRVAVTTLWLPALDQQSLD